MQNADKDLPSITLVSRGIFVKVIITLEPYHIVRGDRDSRATLMPIYCDLYQIKL